MEIIKKLIEKNTRLIKLFGGQAIYLITGKSLGLGIIGLSYFLYPETFPRYAKISISSALIAGVLILGIPYAVQIWSQDLKNRSLRNLLIISILYSSIGFIVLSFLHYEFATFLAVLVLGLSPIWLAHGYEAFKTKNVYFIHFVAVLFTQPLIYAISALTQDYNLIPSGSFFYFAIFLLFSTLFFLYPIFSKYLIIFSYQSMTVILGSALINYFLSEAIYEDESLKVGYLWVLIQLASVVIFLTNSMSFRFISYFSSTDDAVQSSRTRQVYLGYSLLITLVAFLLACIIFIDGAGPICYALYLLVQGLAKIAGSAVLALRKPHIPFFSAIGTFIVVLVCSSIYDVSGSFENGVLIALAGSFGGGLTMILFLAYESKKHKLFNSLS